ncbi:bicaudal-D-related protein 2-like [Hippoglossus stenolepis]|uniref:bicaudal-D-related protein 2-like n=1 Tax=Hippoglossus stenolepis TaxID=195615 RepID=UPI00159CB2DC|nr:bicaudal-D-related protein 2-like [Hippoglossus stenolepis]
MDFSQSFSSLNERLKPRVTSSEQLYSSLNRMEDRQLGSLGSRTSYRPTVLPVDPKGSVIITEPHDPAEPEADAEQEDLVSDDLGKGNCADLRLNTCLLSELNLKDVGDEELADEDSSSTQSEEKDSQGELTTEGTTNSSSSEGGSSLQMSFVDGTLPDLLNSGKTLSRRRTLGHVSASLSEVRREVELSRRRSIKLKAQVDKLHENRSGKGWSQGRERVTEEVLSAVRLLQPLTEPGSSPPEPFQRENGLDSALAQLQNVARSLAISHTKQGFKSGGGRGGEESAILQQALRDRDEAMEKKKAMEAELLRSKTEMMLLNNQLLEAVQKRLELSLEVEAWKEDVQRILTQQLQSQQQAEQAQRKQSRTLGILRRNRPLIQRPTIVPLSAPMTPTTNTNQIFIPRAVEPSASTPGTPSPSVTRRNWMDKLRRGKNNRDAAGQDSEQGKDDGFQAVCLD